MSTYVIGDLQGCAASFDALLERCDFDARDDRVWLVGDLVNRGPDSHGVLRRVIALGDAASVVLGNHDLHLLAVAAGVRKEGRSDTLAALLAAPDVEQLLDWLRHQPLAFRASLPDESDVLMVHAGIVPGWSVDDTMRHAAELEAALQADSWRETLADLFGDKPHRWRDELVGSARLRAIVNVLTRLRFCSRDDRLDFDLKDAPAASSAASSIASSAASSVFRPWFDFEDRGSRASLVVFGHWSTLGVLVRDDVIGLDSGCVWGGALTAIRLEDRALFQVRCPQAQRPG